MNTRSGARAFQRFAGRAGVEAAVEHNLARAIARAARVVRRCRARARPRPGCPSLVVDRQDQPARTPPGVLRDLGELGHVPELVRLAELALRIGLASGSESETSRSRSGSPATRPGDLLDDLLAAAGELLELGANNPGSDNKRSSPARSSGNSRTQSGNASSHNDSACPANSVNIPSPLDQELAHYQRILKTSRTRTETPAHILTFSAGSN